jgi:hypothetical protein
VQRQNIRGLNVGKTMHVGFHGRQLTFKCMLQEGIENMVS